MSSVDVVVPCYRYGRFLKECVESVLAQASSDVRVLIIDDASTDNTAEVATDLCKESSKVTFIRHDTNFGHIATYNEGIEWASADYYMLLSADDYLLPGALCRAGEIMDANPAVGFAFGRALTLSEGGTPQPFTIASHKAGTRVLSGLEFIQLSGAQNIVSSPTAVVRTELQKRIGGYLPTLPHSGDMEMWLRLAVHGDVAMSDAYFAVYRQHTANMSFSYFTEGWLPDLQQRRAAFDSFLESAAGILQGAPDIYRRQLELLACDIVKCASAALSCGDMDLSKRLSMYAVSTHPEIKKSLPWTKLGCKRIVGPTTWKALRSSSAWIRQIIN
jgi:hypothetical protein